ncbi:hypothetical protein GGTG_06944 [Gaeumannomyces tritici R3-111a-1]|uniref:Uncharacterized protein n=1 Tax=Gaeumannomyces tritici (strain R3-111a-1) TaxID=644352 RepID=J3P097_GAET3|nr:hypothetical protein GGTG_06944 [Gaeumannomyces tritici R3-111a-1]EJT77030.1 hypothetical protein GGTG_06944 [Gaeumannomyces tritici R3-111a-1]
MSAMELGGGWYWCLMTVQVVGSDASYNAPSQPGPVFVSTSSEEEMSAGGGAAYLVPTWHLTSCTNLPTAAGSTGNRAEDLGFGSTVPST